MDLSKYYESICKQPILSKEQERELVRVYKDPNSSEEAKDKARDVLIRANLRFVFKQAKKFSKDQPNLFADLISVGNEGLIAGLEKFNPDRGTRLLSYAGWWVKQKILMEMALLRLVWLPLNKQQLSTRIARFKQGRDSVPLKELMAHFPGVPERDLKELSDTRYLTYYIDDLKESEFEIDPIGTEVDRNLDNKKIHTVVYSMQSPHKEVLILTFGFEGDREMSIHQISKKLGIPKDTVKELKKEAMELVREKLSTDKSASSN